MITLGVSDLIPATSLIRMAIYGKWPGIRICRSARRISRRIEKSCFDATYLPNKVAAKYVMH